MNDWSHYPGKCLGAMQRQRIILFKQCPLGKVSVTGVPWSPEEILSSRDYLITLVTVLSLNSREEPELEHPWEEGVEKSQDPPCSLEICPFIMSKMTHIEWISGLIIKLFFQNYSKATHVKWGRFARVWSYLKKKSYLLLCVGGLSFFFLGEKCVE